MNPLSASVERLLIVDDQPLNLELAAALLECEGYDIRTAIGARAALDVMASGFEPRVILMDVQMPGMDGLELTRRLRSDPAHDAVVIIALTASAMSGDEQRFRAAGCDSYLAKPIDTRAFSSQVRTASEARARARLQ